MLALAALAGAVVSLSGCAVWRIQESVALARHSEPFQAAPREPAGSLLVVGDSTAVGTGATSPAHSLAGLIAAEHPRLRVVNRARDGAKFEDIVRQLQPAGERFDVVLIVGGGNDVIRLTAADALRTRVNQAVELASQQAAQVIVMPSGNVGNAPFFFAPVSWLMTRRSRQLHAVAQQAAQARGAQYVNLYKPRAQDPFAQRPGELHAADGLHPANAGYRLWLAELKSQAQLDRTLSAF